MYREFRVVEVVAFEIRSLISKVFFNRKKKKKCNKRTCTIVDRFQIDYGHVSSYIQKIYLSNYSYSLAALLFPYQIRASKRTTKNKSENRGETEIGRGKESNWQSVRGCVSILKRALGGIYNLLKDRRRRAK